MNENTMSREELRVTAVTLPFTAFVQSVVSLTPIHESNKMKVGTLEKCVPVTRSALKVVLRPYFNGPNAAFYLDLESGSWWGQRHEDHVVPTRPWYKDGRELTPEQLVRLTRLLHRAFFSKQESDEAVRDVLTEG